MRALEELPNLTKDQLLPIIHLRPWVGSHGLENTIGRITEAYGDRPVVVAMGEREPPNERPVHTQLDELRHPANGFQHWCSFFQEHGNYIPAIQFSADVPQEEAQITWLFNMGRGLVVIIEPPQFPLIAFIAQRVGQRTQGGHGVCFVIDFGQVAGNHINAAEAAAGFVNSIHNQAPAAFVALSGSSFPDSFTGRTEQWIYERQLFEAITSRNLIYSDRGSARVERQTGGGGQPAPRIDYPLIDQWKFYRSDDLVGFPGYQYQARRLMSDAGVWNANLRVWGTQMIERTAAGDTSAISGAQKATAARINLHLQRQTFYNTPAAAENTDEDWSG